MLDSSLPAWMCHKHESAKAVGRALYGNLCIRPDIKVQM